MRIGRLDDAEACFRQVLAENELSVDANEGAATIAYLRRDYEAAAGYFETAARADARRAAPLINLGAVQNKSKKYAEAIKSLQKALSRDRKNSDAYFNLAVAYRGAGKTSMATNAYKEAIRLNSDFAEAHQNLGLIFLELGNTTQAVNSLKRALELCPTLRRAKLGLRQANAVSSERSDRPFGRLVDPVETSAVGGQTTVLLSESERDHDRQRLQELGVRLERSLEGVLAEVRDVTEPACQQVCRNMTESATPEMHSAAVRSLSATIEQCQWLLSLVDEHIRQMQDHESSVALLMRGDT